jgi:hypothetical protein
MRGGGQADIDELAAEVGEPVEGLVFAKERRDVIRGAISKSQVRGLLLILDERRGPPGR